MASSTWPRGSSDRRQLLALWATVLAPPAVWFAMLQVGYEVDTPPKVESALPPPTSDDQIIVRMDADGKTFINKEEIPLGNFGARLGLAMKGRSNQVVFFAADGELPYEKVALFLDICRDAGARKLGIVFDDIKPPAAS